MLQEIIYTSAPQGLKPGSRGFCTVISSPGMPVNLAQQLEALSGYRHLFPPQDPQAALNPTVYAHLRLNVAGRPLHVLSRIADAGLDYSQRTNKFAHHLVLDAPDCPPGGPAWALATPGLMATGWDGQPRVAPVLRKLPRDERPAGPCTAWEAQLGDAGWAGVLAETAAVGRPAVLLYEPGMEVLPLFVEALSLLPPAQRWTVTFSTFFTRLPPGVNCQWRAVLAGSAEARALAAGPHLVIDLRKPCPAPNGLLVETARTGEAPEQGLEVEDEDYVVAEVEDERSAGRGDDGWGDALEPRLAPPPIPGRQRSRRRPVVQGPREKRDKKSGSYLIWAATGIVLVSVALATAFFRDQLMGAGESLSRRLATSDLVTSGAALVSPSKANEESKPPTEAATPPPNAPSADESKKADEQAAEASTPPKAPDVASADQTVTTGKVDGDEPVKVPEPVQEPVSLPTDRVSFLPSELPSVGGTLAIGTLPRSKGDGKAKAQLSRVSGSRPGSPKLYLRSKKSGWMIEKGNDLSKKELARIENSEGHLTWAWQSTPTSDDLRAIEGHLVCFVVDDAKIPLALRVAKPVQRVSFPPSIGIDLNCDLSPDDVKALSTRAYIHSKHPTGRCVMASGPPPYAVSIFPPGEDVPKSLEFYLHVAGSSMEDKRSTIRLEYRGVRVDGSGLRWSGLLPSTRDPQDRSIVLCTVDHLKSHARHVQAILQSLAPDAPERNSLDQERRESEALHSLLVSLEDAGLCVQGVKSVNDLVITLFESEGFDESKVSQ